MLSKEVSDVLRDLEKPSGVYVAFTRSSSMATYIARCPANENRAGMIKPVAETKKDWKGGVVIHLIDWKDINGDITLLYAHKIGSVVWKEMARCNNSDSCKKPPIVSVNSCWVSICWS